MNKKESSSEIWVKNINISPCACTYVIILHRKFLKGLQENAQNAYFWRGIEKLLISTFQSSCTDFTPSYFVKD